MLTTCLKITDEFSNCITLVYNLCIYDAGDHVYATNGLRIFSLSVSRSRPPIHKVIYQCWREWVLSAIHHLIG